MACVPTAVRRVASYWLPTRSHRLCGVGYQRHLAHSMNTARWEFEGYSVDYFPQYLKSIYHNEHVTEVQGWQGTKATSMK
jgi:hypothetical protein